MIPSSNISVIIPVRGAKEWLLAACRSALSDELAREVIVVDDGGNAEVLAALAGESDARIRLTAGPRRGVSAARNAGQEAARGDIVAFLDADDVFEAGGLAALVSPIRSGPCGAVIGRWRDADADMTPFREADLLPNEVDALTALIQRPTIVSAFAARRPWPTWDESISVWEVSRWQHDVVSDGRRVESTNNVVTRARQHTSESRLSLTQDHFDAGVCGRFWLAEKRRIGSSAGLEARFALERRIADAIYCLLREERVGEAKELWLGVDRGLLRTGSRARIGQPRWLGGWLGMHAMRAHAVAARLR